VDTEGSSADHSGVADDVRLDGPIDVPESLEFFRRTGDDLIDRFDGRTFVRVLRAGSAAHDGGAVVMTPAGDVEHPRLHVRCGPASGCRPDYLPKCLRSAAASQFVTAHQALAELCARDRHVARLAGRRPGVCLVTQTDLLTALVRSVSAQQLNLRWAATIRSRLARRYGIVHRCAGYEAWSLDADLLAGARVADLRALQLTVRKSEYLIAIAAEVASGRLTMAELTSLDDDGVIERLTRMHGIGRWSAEWFLARTLGRPRVVAGDLGVRKAVGLLYELPAVPAEPETRQLTAHWGDAATVAQQLALADAVSGSA
jgi:DNA-3-methyladenine glycosylase II